MKIPAFIILFGALTTSFGHGDLHERIEVLNRQIAASPQDTTLLLQRAHLHFEHQDWTQFEADLRQCSSHPEAAFLRARGYYKRGEFKQAEALFSEQIEANSEDAVAYLWRARSRLRQDKPVPAAHDFQLVLNRGAMTDPELYLEYARVLISLDQTKSALLILDRGSKELHHPPSLESFALTVEENAGLWAEALGRVDRWIEKSSRKERLLYRRGEVLIHLGRHAEAKKSLHAARLLIDSLTPAQRNNPAILNLTSDIEETLTKLTSCTTEH